jgi:hypothetical protein
MKSAAAIQRFFNIPGPREDMNYSRASVSEIKELKESCSPEEWHELGRQACVALGEEHEI